VPDRDESPEKSAHKVRKRTQNEIDTKEWIDTKPSLEEGCLNTFLSPYNVVEKQCKEEVMFEKEWVYQALLHWMDRKMYVKMSVK